MKNNFMVKHFVCFSLLLLLGRNLSPDAAGYAGNKVFLAKNDDLTVIHGHNWSQETREKRWRMIIGDQNPFTRKNDYAYIECVNNKTHDVLFKTPTPALTHLYISEDSRYIVGLSNIKLDNPVQLVLLDNSGKVVFYMSISSEEAKLSMSEYQAFESKFPKEARKLKANNQIFKIKDTLYLNYNVMPFGEKVRMYLFNYLVPSHFSKNFSESETNFIDWYKTPDPEIRLRYENGKVSAISLLDPAGERCEIQIHN
ncbi:MAG: hypothetical protein MUO31_09465 [Thermodesulfovibrionales bacterium]|nr:hypothetical protein [Thermodesulfovibrionales bacterium]